MRIIIEVHNCGECPHLDARWTKPPWRCEEDPVLAIGKRHMERVHPDCPLLTRKEYLAEEKKP